MKNITIKSSDNFENTIQVFKKTIIEIQDIFDREDVNMDKIDSTKVWTSDTQKEITLKYKELKSDYSNIIDSLNNYVSFMSKALDAYKTYENSLDNLIDSSSVNLNVN